MKTRVSAMANHCNDCMQSFCQAVQQRTLYRSWKRASLSHPIAVATAYLQNSSPDPCNGAEGAEGRCTGGTN